MSSLVRSRKDMAPEVVFNRTGARRFTTEYGTGVLDTFIALTTT